MGRAEDFLKRQQMKRGMAAGAPLVSNVAQRQSDNNGIMNRNVENRSQDGNPAKEKTSSDVLAKEKFPARWPSNDKSGRSTALPGGGIYINTAQRPSNALKYVACIIPFVISVAAFTISAFIDEDDHAGSRNHVATKEPVCTFADSGSSLSTSSGGEEETREVAGQRAPSIYDEAHRDNSGEYSASYYTQQHLYQRIDAAEKNYDWENAIRFVRQDMAESAWIGAAASDASSLVRLSLLYWNHGDKSNAINSLESAVDKMKNGSGLGGGCEKLALALLAKMRAGRLPRMLDSDALCGVLNYVMAPVCAKNDSSHRAFMARMDAHIGRIDAQTSLYEAQGHWQSKAGKFYARETYREQTGKTFDPDHPPSYGSRDRESWNSAKRIYDIFGD